MVGNGAGGSQTGVHASELRWRFEERPVHRLVVSGMLIACALRCGAEPRWCSVIGRGPQDKVSYPPIARYARVTGVVIGIVTFIPNGASTSFEPISGPRLLSDSLGGQLSGWTINSDALGNEPCRSLVIATFLMDESGPADPSTGIKYEAGSVLRLSVNTFPPPPLDVSISDPAPLRGIKLLRSQIRWKLTRIFNWISHRDTSSTDKPPKVS
jgi:hypothetical protein